MTNSRFKAPIRGLFLFALISFLLSTAAFAQKSNTDKEQRELHYYSSKSKKVEGENVILTLWFSKGKDDAVKEQKMVNKLSHYDGVLGVEFLPVSSIDSYLECKMTLFKGATNEYIQKMFERYKITYIYLDDEKILVSQFSNKLYAEEKLNHK